MLQTTLLLVEAAAEVSSSSETSLDEYWVRGYVITYIASRALALKQRRYRALASEGCVVADKMSVRDTKISP